jgi:NAD(P)-dependent dehydrogenase (short-subunit alcohol dehydrogenase family)
VTVNAICPAAKSVAFMRALGDNPEIATFADAMNPMGRIGDPYLDIAPVALFLASEGCRYLTGNTLFVDGGSHINGVAWTPDLDRAGDDQQGSAIRKGREERRIQPAP